MPMLSTIGRSDRLAIGIAIVLFMVRDLTPDLQQAPWAVKANAGLGIPANIVLLIGIAGIVSTIAYLVPQTSMLGAIRHDITCWPS